MLDTRRFLPIPVHPAVHPAVHPVDESSPGTTQRQAMLSERRVLGGGGGEGEGGEGEGEQGGRTRRENRPKSVEVKCWDSAQFALSSFRRSLIDQSLSHRPVALSSFPTLPFSSPFSSFGPRVRPHLHPPRIRPSYLIRRLIREVLEGTHREPFGLVLFYQAAVCLILQQVESYMLRLPGLLIPRRNLLSPQHGPAGSGTVVWVVVGGGVLGNYFGGGEDPVPAQHGVLVGALEGFGGGGL